MLIARGEDGLRAAATAVEEAGGSALAVPTDVADFQAVERAAEQAETQFGPIDVWVNVAFTSVFAPFWEIKPEEFRRVTEVSYLGFVHGTMAALARMRPRDRGTIIQVGSALSYRAIPLQSAYCGAKHAINGFTESVRCELLHDGSHVRITVVQMPAVNTPQFSWVLSRLPRRPQPVPPIYQPEVAAQGVVFAADHPDRKEHWVGASTVGTIMAQKFAAPLLDRYLGRTGYDSQQTKEPGRARPAVQPLAAGRPAARQRPRRARRLRRQVPSAQRAAQRHRASRAGRRCGPPRVRRAARRRPPAPAHSRSRGPRRQASRPTRTRSRQARSPCPRPTIRSHRPRIPSPGGIPLLPVGAPRRPLITPSPRSRLAGHASPADQDEPEPRRS